MCIGIAMKVVSTRPGHALAAGRGEQREVDTALVGAVQPGEWLLIFINSARERISAVRAAEINTTLDLLQAALAGAPAIEPTFTLPSAMSAAQLSALLTQEISP